jgi:hypothetical protein
MTTELPYEIWLHIVSFLDTATIRQLRFVNTLLYNLSLDDYHRITQIGYPSHPPTDNAPLRYVNSGINLDLDSKLSLNHRDPGYAQRVRVLIIRRGPIYPQKYEPTRRRLGFKWPIWKSMKAKFSQMRRHVIGHEPEASLDKLLNAVPGLTTLTTLNIYLPYSCWDDHSLHCTKLSVIKAGWPIFAANLTTLTSMCHWKRFTLSCCPISRSSGWRNSLSSSTFFQPPNQTNSSENRYYPFLSTTARHFDR